MAKISAADIKALRDQTGAGMMDVKNALVEAEGDAEKALEIIRVKGLKGIAKREGRSASDGVVVVEVVDGDEGQVGIMVEVNSETDFVAKTEKFGEFAKSVLDAAVASGAKTLEELLAYVHEGETVAQRTEGIAAIIGEKIQVRRLARLTGEKIDVYLHRTAKDLPPQVGVMVATDAAAASVAHDIAMHIAAFTPTYLNRDEVPADTVANERRIAEETSRAEGKPEKALPMIIEGRMNGFFKENCLLEQAYARDPKTTVGKVAQAAGGSVTGFARFRVGA